jgi:TetR/AcrR family transcriptional regulator, transcriptional repressor for nem operon
MGRTSDAREKLIETATELIWRDSYNSVSVDDICKKAGVKKGSFYHYFPSKIDLVNATMSHCMEYMKHQYDDMFSPTREPLERFDLMIDHVIENQKEIAAKYGHVCGCPFVTLGSELAAQDENMANTIGSILDKKTNYYKSALKDLQSEKRIDPETDLDEKAKEIFAFIVGQLTIARIRDDIDFLESNLKKSLRNLIGLI